MRPDFLPRTWLAVAECRCCQWLPKFRFAPVHSTHYRVLWERSTRHTEHRVRTMHRMEHRVRTTHHTEPLALTMRHKVHQELTKHRMWWCMARQEQGKRS